MTGIVAAGASAAEIQYLPEKQATIIFPFSNTLGQDKAQLADDLLVMLRGGLSLTGRFMVLAYDWNSSVSVQRAVAEQKIKESEIRTAFPTDPQGVERARKVCKAIAADLAVIGSIDSYSFSETTKETKIGITVQVLRADPDVQPVTIAVTGIAAGKPDDPAQTESGIAVAAIDDAADKILSRMLDAAKVTVSADTPPVEGQVYVPEEKQKSNKKGLFTAMLGALLLGLALGGN